MTREEQLVELALKQAGRAWGNTHPNPMVGALIVEDGEIVAAGYHRAAGQDHAEVDALKNLGRRPRSGASMYVTLEPCCTFGRTPPCTQAIIEAGIKHVVIGAVDPNPNVAGQGVAVLRENGVEVSVGVLEEDCRDLNLLYNHWITMKRPLLAAKVATTLDGAIATRTGHSQWITSEASRKDVMRWRRLFPGIGVGSGTALQDNPQLTSRIPEQPVFCPTRFVFDNRQRTLDADLHLHTDNFAAETIVVTTQTPANHDFLSSIWQLPADEEGHPCMSAFQAKCYEEGILGVYIEGGSAFLNSLMRKQELDYLFAYRAPKILADSESKPAFSGRITENLNQAMTLHSIKHANLGDDQLIRGFFEKS